MCRWRERRQLILRRRRNWIKTCSILTTTPNAVTTAIHDRMPVILDPDNYDLWLDPGMTSVITSKAANGYHFKTGQRDWSFGTENVLPCRLLWWQVGFGAPASRAALERGAVEIVNRKKLEDSACECYGVIRQYDGELGLK
jgi:hypothetical protein